MAHETIFPSETTTPVFPLDWTEGDPANHETVFPLGQIGLSSVGDIAAYDAGFLHWFDMDETGTRPRADSRGSLDLSSGGAWELGRVVGNYTSYATCSYGDVLQNPFLKRATGDCGGLVRNAAKGLVVTGSFNLAEFAVVNKYYNCTRLLYHPLNFMLAVEYEYATHTSDLKWWSYRDSGIWEQTSVGCGSWSGWKQVTGIVTASLLSLFVDGSLADSTVTTFTQVPANTGDFRVFEKDLPSESTGYVPARATCEYLGVWNGLETTVLADSAIGHAKMAEILWNSGNPLVWNGTAWTEAS